MSYPHDRTRSIAKSRMFKSGNTSNRAEEELVYNLIGAHISSDWYVQKQVRLKDIVPIPNDIDLTGDRSPKVDVLVINRTTKQKVAIRIMGHSHDKDNDAKQFHYDKLQKMFLEHELNGYTVIDVWYYDHDVVWNCSKKLRPSVEELQESYFQLRKTLSPTLNLNQDFRLNDLLGQKKQT